MARERMVTRTVKTVVCDVMCVNIATRSVENHEAVISATIPEEKRMLEVQKQFDSFMENITAVAITGTREVETLYGMPEDEFIKLARILPNR